MKVITLKGKAMMDFGYTQIELGDAQDIKRDYQKDIDLMDTGHIHPDVHLGLVHATKNLGALDIEPISGLETAAATESQISWYINNMPEVAAMIEWLDSK